MSAEEARRELERLNAERTEMIAQADALRETRAHLPRSDKKRAHEMLQAIDKLGAQVKALRPQIAHYQTVINSKEAHGLWATAVLEICGPEALRECQDHMRAARKAGQRGGVEAEPVVGPSTKSETK